MDCSSPAPPPDNHVICNRDIGHDGPHRGDVHDDEVIFWGNGKLLTRLVRDERNGDRWIMQPIGFVS